MAIFKEESKLTDRYQTTVPESVRKVLRLNKRDKIQYIIQEDGQVIISRAQPEEEDPVIGQFLDFLARDMDNNPEHIQLIISDLPELTKSLVGDVEFDIDAPLSEEDE